MTATTRTARSLRMMQTCKVGDLEPAEQVLLEEEPQPATTTNFTRAAAVAVGILITTITTTTTAAAVAITTAMARGGRTLAHAMCHHRQDPSGRTKAKKDLGVENGVQWDQDRRMSPRTMITHLRYEQHIYSFLTYSKTIATCSDSITDISFVFSACSPCGPKKIQKSKPGVEDSTEATENESTKDVPMKDANGEGEEAKEATPAN